MSPLTPHWTRPSHPEIQEVIINEAEFSSKSLSRATVPPFGLFAKMAFPPCTLATEPTYATVQISRDRHLNLNSDLLYINHSCEPSLIFDTTNLNVIAGPKGLQPGDELTFFYPSTEWEMAQPFQCLCGTPSCCGTISGASSMPAAELSGLWLNGHIRELLQERRDREEAEAAAAAAAAANNSNNTFLILNGKGTHTYNGHSNGLVAAIDEADPTAQALKDALQHAERVVEAARAALLSYLRTTAEGCASVAATADVVGTLNGAARRGTTSREMSGEMGGDTVVS